MVEEVLAGIASDAQHVIRELQKSGEQLVAWAWRMNRMRGTRPGLRAHRVG